MVIFSPTSAKTKRGLLHTWKDRNGTGAKPALWPEIFQNLGRFSGTPGLAIIDERQSSWSDTTCWFVRLIWLLPLHLRGANATRRLFLRSTRLESPRAYLESAV